MFRATALIAAIAIAGATSVAHAGTSPSSELTKDKVTQLKSAWGDGIVKIGSVHAAGGDYRAAAREHINKFYAYSDGEVLFKPTLASEDQFRGTFDEALSYLVGGGMAEDSGFAIAPYTAVRWENEGTIVSGDTALAMGNYYFMRPNGDEVKVEYTFGFEKFENGETKIVLHHSSIPYKPAQ